MEQRVVAPLEAADPQIARWLWALEDARRRTEAALVGLTPAVVEWTPPAGCNPIGALLYHIPLIEADYLYADILGLPEEDFPAEIAALFPLPDRDEASRLTVPPPTALDDHLRRCAAVRRRLLTVFTEMTPEDFRRPRTLPDSGYEITPEWTLHHLMQHEAGHRGELATIRTHAEAALR